MAPKKRSKHSGSMRRVITVFTIAAITGSVLSAFGQGWSGTTSAKALSRTSTRVLVTFDRLRVLAIGKIDDVVGQPAQRVDGIDVLALRPGQQGGAPEVGGAVLPGQFGAAPVALGQQAPHAKPTRSSPRGPGR